MSDFYRDKPEFDAVEDKFIKEFKDKGFEFSFELDYDYHHATNDGYEVLFKSPRMARFEKILFSNNTRLTRKKLIEEEKTRAVECAFEEMESVLETAVKKELAITLNVYSELKEKDYDKLKVAQLLIAPYAKQPKKFKKPSKRVLVTK